MAKKRHHRKGGRTIPKGTRPEGFRPRSEAPGHGGRSAGPSGDPAIDGLIADTTSRLRDESPLPLLELASMLVEATSPRPLDNWPGSQREVVEADELFGSFVSSGIPAMAGLAYAAAAIHPLPDFSRVLHAAAEDVGALRVAPTWLASIGSIKVIECLLQSEILGDGDNILIAVEWPAGERATALIYIDHNMGTLVKDAFCVPVDIDELREVQGGLQPEGITSIAIEPSDARARIEEAIAHSERCIPPIESESWPAVRPLVEWILGHLPEGGEGYVRPAWSEADRAELIADFVGSTFGRVKNTKPADVADWSTR